MALALMATTAIAQIVSSNSRNVITEPSDNSGYNRLSISYQQLKLTAHGYKGESTDGVNVEYLHGYNVVKTQPLFVETGIYASLNSGHNFEAIRIGIPVNLAYKYTIQPVNLWGQPYTDL